MDRPRVTLKLATSLDGRIATASGESRWITGLEARAQGHKLRAGADAIMIGAGTARTDNPSLLARTPTPPARQPKRVVLSKRFDIPTHGPLFEHLDASPLIVVGGEGAPGADVLAKAGAKIARIANEGPDVAVNLALDCLRVEWNIASILVEGGGRLAASLIAAGLVDRIEWFRAPIVLGAEGAPCVGALAVAALSEAPAWRRVALGELGPDVWESYERA